MKTCKIALLPLLVVFIFSCKKESTGGQRGNGQNGIAGDSTELWQLITIDTTQPAGNDTIQKFVFTYDNQGRVNQINTYNPGILHDVSTFYYQGSDTMANKVFSFSNYASFVETDSTFFSYGQGYVNYDSSIRQSNLNREIRVHSYSLRGDTLAIQSKQSTIYGTSPPIICNQTWTLIMAYVSGNMVTKDGSTSGNCGTNIPWHEQHQYDDKVNPLYSSGMHYRIVGILHILSLLNAQKNNAISSSVTGSSNSSLVYNYTYRNDGYPLIKRAKDLLDPSFHSKTIYIYHQ